MPHSDELFEQFVQAYPAARRQRGYMATQLFIAALSKVSFDVLMEALDQHGRSEQWRDKTMVPLMTKWLEQERWIQILPECRVDQARSRARLTPFEQARRAGLK